MSRINPAPPLNVSASPVNGAPTNKLTEPDLPFSAVSNATWEAEALDQTHAVTDKRTFHVLNGRRVAAWRICVEKKCTERIKFYFGGTSHSLTVLPPDCESKILEFLAPTASSPGGRLTPADLERIAKKREAEIVDTWIDLILAELEKHATEYGWSSLSFPAGFLNEENTGGTLNMLAVAGGKWWQVEPLLAKLRGLGWTVHTKGNGAGNVLSVGTY